ncbi:MAG: amino acid adenylation domain-containing protein [Pyrinomonadaceae bacterium]
MTTEPVHEGAMSRTNPTSCLPISNSIGEMIAAHAHAQPDAPAVVIDGRVVTYGELDRRANQLANHLINSGVRTETIVAICLNRSTESLVSAVAVLKAGGAYLPLDPNLPLERLNVMLNAARPRVLITNSDNAERIARPGCSIVTIDSDAEIEKCAVNAPSIEIAKDQLAYVIYTSGSTGEPKGVEITIGNLLNLVAWHQSEFKISSKDRATHLAGVGFDAAVWEVWPYLTAGASLYLPDEATRLMPEGLRDWMLANEITVSFLPTALTERVMILDWPRDAALRFLLTGADTLHRYPENDLPFELVNNYGPTECTVVATSGRVQNSNTSDLPTIGRAISNTQVYILDENLVQVPPGEAGEIFIGGANVGRGYLNQSDLTLKKFIHDPFSTQPGARLYRTGDLARQLPNGDIAYVGRADEQIKILGNRIEPAEIEAAIDRHPVIASSVVVARRTDCSEKLLTAYVTMRNGSTLSATEMRSFLHSSLPDCMLPAIFVKLDRLPLTSNGKIDRASLPDPSTENRLRDDDFGAPQSPTEERLAAILCSLFNVNEVSINDNFFLLGGHSLLGAQLIVKIRAAFGVDLALRTLFDAPTVAALSAEIERMIVARVENMTDAEAQALVA